MFNFDLIIIIFMFQIFIKCKLLERIMECCKKNEEKK